MLAFVSYLRGTTTQMDGLARCNGGLSEFVDQIFDKREPLLRISKVQYKDLSGKTLYVVYKSTVDYNKFTKFT